MRKLWYSPTLRSVVIYGASGLGFAGANLVLARVLPAAEYGLFTLVIALMNLSFALAPAGVDGMVNRRRLDAGPALLRSTLAAGFVTGVVFVVIAEVMYEMSIPLVLMLFMSTVAGGAMVVAGAQFQSEQRFGTSLALTQSPNLAMLIAALVVVVSGSREVLLPVVICALGFVVAATVGWSILFRERHAKPAGELSFPWSEALSFVGLNAAGLLLVQLDRLIIPHVLPLRDLATFGVLAAIAGSLFRVLSMGVGYTLMPRLRAARSVLERRHLVAQEAKLVSAIVVAGSLAIWFVTPVIEQWFLVGKYHLSASLVFAAIVGGVAKVGNSFSRATVIALANPTELALVTLFGWLSVAVAVVAAVLGARWGLVGLMYGMSLGWFTRAFTGFYLILRYLKLPGAVPAAAPSAASTE